jgi:hypothetical protein
MSDIFARTGRDRAGRVRLRLAWRGLGLPGRPRRRPAGSARVPARSRTRRRLAAIDRALAVETPRLASMFAMFNELAGGEEPVTAEQLPSRGPRPRPRPAQIAFLATLAAIVALCVALSTQVHTVIRPCRVSAAASPAASQPTGQATYAPMSGLSCQAYATTNK